MEDIIEKPRIPAPLAVNLLRSRRTSGESMISMGIRFPPMKSPVIEARAHRCSSAVGASRKMRETCWPVVPEEVTCRTTSSSGTLARARSLKRATGI